MNSTNPSPHHQLPKSHSYFDEWFNIPSKNSSSSIHPITSLIQCLDPKAHINEYWEQLTRPDGRLFTQGRTTQAVYGMLKHSAGSALVSQNESGGHISGTKILAATTFNIGQPSPEQPDEGEVVVQVSGTGGRNVAGDSKSQQHYWESLQSWLQRTIEQDEMMAKSLNLLTGKSCLQLVITVMVLEDNGNVKDTALLACMAAWKDTRLPKVGKDLTEVQGKLWLRPHPELPVNINEAVRCASNEETPNDQRVQRHYRVSLTMGIWVHPRDQTIHLIADPSNLEEPFFEGSITIVVSLANEKLQVDYTGKVPLTGHIVALAAKLALARAREVTTILS